MLVECITFLRGMQQQHKSKSTTRCFSMKKLLVFVVLCFGLQFVLLVLIFHYTFKAAASTTSTHTAKNPDTPLPPPSTAPQQPQIQVPQQHHVQTVSFPAQYPYYERKWPDYSVLVIVLITVDDPGLDCKEMRATMDSVFGSSWINTRVRVMEPEFRKDVWSQCVNEQQAHYRGSVKYISRNNPSATLGQNLHALVDEERPGYFLILEVGDVIDATYVEKAIWMFFYRKHRLAYVSSFWSIGAHQMEMHSCNGNTTAVLGFYGTSPASIFRTDAMLHAKGFETVFEQYGCNDWEMKWRVHLAGWGSYTIHEVLYKKHLLNVNSPKVQTQNIVRCTIKEHSNRFLAYLRRTYSLTRDNFWVDPLVDTVFNMKRQQILYNWDPIDIVSRPNSRSKEPERRGVLVLIPGLKESSADQFALNLIHAFSEMQWHVTVLLTGNNYGNAWESLAKQDTVDIFTLSTIIHRSLYPQFICHLIRSRGIEAIIMSNSAVAYLSLPFIKAFCPVGAVINVNHNWLEGLFDGGFTSFEYQDFIDYHVQFSSYYLVSTEGINQAKIKTINVGINASALLVNHQENIISSSGGQCLNILLPQMLHSATQKHSMLVVLIMDQLSTAKEQLGVFVECMRRLKEQGYTNRVLGIVIANSNGYELANTFIAHQNASDGVMVVSPRNLEEQGKLLRCADVLMSTSTMPSIELLEALTIGAFVVAPRGGVLNMFPKLESFLIDTKGSKEEQVTQFVKQIKKVLHMNPSKLGQYKRLIAKQARVLFDVTTMGKQYELLIDHAQKQQRKLGWKHISKIPKWPLQKIVFSPAIGASRFALHHGEW